MVFTVPNVRRHLHYHCRKGTSEVVLIRGYRGFLGILESTTEFVDSMALVVSPLRRYHYLQQHTQIQIQISQ